MLATSDLEGLQTPDHDLADVPDSDLESRPRKGLMTNGSSNFLP